jgi:hypothetical protein
LKKFFLILTLLLLAAAAGALLFLLAFVLHWNAWIAALGPIIFLVLPGLYFTFARFWAWREKRLYAKNVLNQDPTIGPALNRLDPLAEKFALRLKELSPAERASLKRRPWLLTLGDPTYKGPTSRQSSFSPASLGDGPPFPDPYESDFQAERVSSLAADRDEAESLWDFSFPEGAVSIANSGFTSYGERTGFSDLDPETLNSLVKILKEETAQGLAALTLYLPVSLLVPQATFELNRYADQARRRILDLYEGLDSQFPVLIALTDLESVPGLAAGALALSRAGLSLSLGVSSASPKNPSSRPPLPLTQRSDSAPLTTPTFSKAATLNSPLDDLSDFEDLNDDELEDLDLDQSLTTRVASNAANRLKKLLTFVFFKDLANQGVDSAGPILLARKTVSTLKKPLAAFLGQLARPGANLPPPFIQDLYLLPTAISSPGVKRTNFRAIAINAAAAGAGVLPLVRPLALPGTYKQKKIKLAYLSWWAVLLLICLAALANVKHNRAVLAAAGSDPARNFTISSPADDPRAALNAAYGLSRFWERLELADRDDLWPALGLNRAGQRLDQAKEAFFQGFETASLGLEAALTKQVAEGETPAKRFLGLRQLLWLAEAYRLGLDDDFLGLETLLSAFPAWPAGFSGDSQPFWNLVYGELLVDYLKGRPPRERPLRTLSRLELLIFKAIPESGGEDFGWLLDWAKALPENRPVSLATGLEGDVFARLSNRAKLAEVAASHTKKGREAIVAALSQLARIHRHPEAFTPRAKAFLADYDRDYLAKWRSFGLFAAAGAERLTRPGELSVYVDNAIRLMNEHLSPFVEKDSAPPFARNLELEVAQNLLHRKVRRSQNPASGGGGLAGLLEKADFLASDALSLRELLDPRQYRDSDLVGRIMSGSQPYKDYHAALALANQAISGQPAEATAMARTHFGGPAFGDPAQSPFTLAEKALDRYLAFFYQGPGQESDDPVKELVKAPLINLQNLLAQETAKSLDRQWEVEVLAPTRFLSESEARQALYSPNGLLDKFLADRAAPFLLQKGQVYRPAAWRGREFPFNEDFLRLLAVGRLALAPLEPIKERYPVKLSVLFAEVNDEATEKPQKSSISLKSPDGTTVIENFNYPVSQTFDFRPGISGDVEVEIAFPSLTLALLYQGPDAFAYFLRDVATGELTLTRGDFPEDEETLESLGVSQIRLAIEAEGARPALKFVDLAEAPKLPTSIIKEMSFSD